MEATSACEPSPPAIPRQSAPREIASCANCARSSPWSSITVSTPSEDANSTNSNFWTFPPPDHGLHSRTGCDGRFTWRIWPAALVRRLNRERRPRRQNGDGEKREADDRSDEGCPVLVPRYQQGGDEECRTQDHPDDSVSTPRSPFRDRPPPAGDCRARSRPFRQGRTRRCGSGSRAARPRGARPRRARRSPAPAVEPWRRHPSHACGVAAPRSTPRDRLVLTSLGRWSLRCRSGVVMTVHHFLIPRSAAL